MSKFVRKYEFKHHEYVIKKKDETVVAEMNLARRILDVKVYGLKFMCIFVLFRILDNF